MKKLLIIEYLTSSWKSILLLVIVFSMIATYALALDLMIKYFPDSEVGTFIIMGFGLLVHLYVLIEDYKEWKKSKDL